MVVLLSTEPTNSSCFVGQTHFLAWNWSNGIFRKSNCNRFSRLVLHQLNGFMLHETSNEVWCVYWYSFGLVVPLPRIYTAIDSWRRAPGVAIRKSRQCCAGGWFSIVGRYWWFSYFSYLLLPMSYLSFCVFSPTTFYALLAKRKTRAGRKSICAVLMQVRDISYGIIQRWKYSFNQNSGADYI